MKKLKALIVGQNMELLLAIPSFVYEAGLSVDMISAHSLITKNHFIENYEFAESWDRIIEILAQRNLDQYDWIILASDEVIECVLSSNLPLEKKRKLLPVKSEENFCHLHSKIGLSKVLTQKKIVTPPFAIANDFNHLSDAAAKVGYPLMVKKDFSSGGLGVFECKNFSELAAYATKISSYPLLLQKKINGRELDLSALYQDGELIHFSYSEILKVYLNKFGPSFLRKYYQLSNFDQKLFLEMRELGQALGANGFATISCIESSEDGKRYFIEADMRPNAWIAFPKFIGDNAAKKMARWFTANEKMSYPFTHNNFFPPSRIMPYFLRMKFWEVLLNRYAVWSFMSQEDRNIFWITNKIAFISLFNKYLKICCEFFARVKSNSFLPKHLQRFF